MSHLRDAGHFTVHNTHLAIDCDHPPILEALQARLRHFPTADASAIDLLFVFDRVAGGAHHVIERPAGAL